MKKTRIIAIALISVCCMLVFTNCATIFGGNKYWAKVRVSDHPNAKIAYNGAIKGTGEANFRVPRNSADYFSVTIDEEGCEKETKTFHGRTFRGWAFASSLVFWTGFTSTGIPLPWGVALDLATGSYWKPDIHQPGISKLNYDHYIYHINYTGCENKKEKIVLSE